MISLIIFKTFFKNLELEHIHIQFTFFVPIIPPPLKGRFGTVHHTELSLVVFFSIFVFFPLHNSNETDVNKIARLCLLTITPVYDHASVRYMSV